MAKIIENINDNVLKEGKKILLEDGYQKMTLRLVASKCNIATGTVYNYFKSKDELVATIMLEDWMKLLEKTKPKLEQAKNMNDGFKMIFEMIHEYASIYHKIWLENNHSLITVTDKHTLLIHQIVELIEPLYIYFKKDKSSITFISEVLLNSAIRDDVTYIDIKPYLLKIIDEEGNYE